MILPLLVAFATDPYDAVGEAERHARECEMRVIGDAFLAPSELSMDDWHVEARRACTVAWKEHAQARRAYFRSHRLAVKRRVPFFRPDVEACWSAFDVVRNQWPAAQQNIALEECKNAKN